MSPKWKPEEQWLLHMSGPMHMHRKIMMHMTFFWGNNTDVLFTGWSGTNTRMYALTLAFFFAMCFVVEGLSHCRLLKPRSNRSVVAGLAQTLMHAMRMGLAYMVTLAVMSFNSGVFLATVAGHASGFLSVAGYSGRQKHVMFSRRAPTSLR